MLGSRRKDGEPAGRQRGSYEGEIQETGGDGGTDTFPAMDRGARAHLLLSADVGGRREEELDLRPLFRKLHLILYAQVGSRPRCIFGATVELQDVSSPKLDAKSAASDMRRLLPVRSDGGSRRLRRSSDPPKLTLTTT